MTWIDPSEIAFYLAAGASLGAVYFVLLLRAVRLHAAPGSAVRFLAFYVLRFAAAASVFWVIAQQGLLPMLSALSGFVLARLASQVLVRWG